ncbi:DUF4132 domain-containing protein [Actinacidiphila glaucinigra]|uniref:DUF4132 domain-containing protein n=1 Tax=Actinacidiphila glaucinigra TaxID=235986 RepID=UPI00366B19A8
MSVIAWGDVEGPAVPGYGLGVAQRLGGVTAELGIRDGRAVLGWRNATGKALKGAPAVVRRDHAGELTRLRTAVRDIDRTLAAQAGRLDRQFPERRALPYAVWRRGLADHPLLGTLARRLLWTVDGVACGWAEGGLRALDGEPVPVGGGRSVALWHPLGRERAEITAWREWLERHGVTQPFRQAHREVYGPADAAGLFATPHVLRQHPFAALAAARGWRYRPRLPGEDTFPHATRELPRWGLRAELPIQGVGGDGDWDGDWAGDCPGGPALIGTDQVRFLPLDAPASGRRADPLPLADVPPLVLSEVLRDADLFVGAAGIGNDPTWQDGGPDGRFRAYWASCVSGELTPCAETRREVVSRLVPRLAIAGRCAVEGRFLRVRGDRHTYRIHLGSGDVLMSPDDRHLCVIPPATAGAVPGPLPFEGDPMLPVILAKALLLARDTEITDPTIVSRL